MSPPFSIVSTRKSGSPASKKPEKVCEQYMDQEMFNQEVLKALSDFASIHRIHGHETEAKMQQSMERGARMKKIVLVTEIVVIAFVALWYVSFLMQRGS